MAQNQTAVDKSELMQQIKKDEARLMQRSVEELHQLLEYAAPASPSACLRPPCQSLHDVINAVLLCPISSHNHSCRYMEVEVDSKLDSKERLIKLIINQKNLPAVSAALAPELGRWRQRSRSASVVDIS